MTKAPLSSSHEKLEQLKQESPIKITRLFSKDTSCDNLNKDNALAKGLHKSRSRPLSRGNTSDQFSNQQQDSDDQNPPEPLEVSQPKRRNSNETRPTLPAMAPKNFLAQASADSFLQMFMKLPSLVSWVRLM